MIPGTYNNPSEKAFVLIDRTLGTNIGDMITGGGLAATFDGVTVQTGAAASSKASVPGYVGKTLAARKVFGKATLHGSTTQGYSGSGGQTVTLTMYGKQGAAPATGVDGTIIGAITFTDAVDDSAPRDIASTDLVTGYDHIWVQRTGTGGGCRLGELIMYEWV